MRSRIEPMKKIARSLRQHRELTLNYFRAKNAFQRSRGGFEQQGQNHHEKILWLSHVRVLELAPSIIHLASCPSQNQPTNSSDEPFFGGEPFQDSQFPGTLKSNSPRD
jgi:hypothetical protein